MSDQEQQLTETPVSSNDLEKVTNNDNLSSDNIEKIKENELNPSEQCSTRRITMPQDIRYSTEHNDREKLIEKYNDYQVSDINACNIRFLTDHRQKKSLLGRNEEENSNLHSLSKTFNVNMFPGYQHMTKHSYKIFGSEANVRKCLMEIMNRMFKRSYRSTQRDCHEINHQQTTSNMDKQLQTEVVTEKEDNDKSSEPTSTCVTTINPDSSTIDETNSAAPIISNNEKTQETEVSTENKNVNTEAAPHSPSICVTIINDDSSATEEKETIPSSTSNTNEEKPDDNNEIKHDHIEEEQFKFIPLERKPQFTFIMLISNQGQEVLKKNWNFFGGSLQQRLNIVVTNPVKLAKFGDKQIHNELLITGELIENLTDATLQIAAFINDVLGVPPQPYTPDEETTNHDNHSYRSCQEQSSSNHHARTFFYRNRNGAFEQVILIRSDCVGRIVGIRASNLKRIQAKCHLRDIIVGRQANENGYVECILAAYQTRNLHFAINTIRSFLRNEDDTAVLVMASEHNDNISQNSPHLHELIPPDVEQSATAAAGLLDTNEDTGFLTKSLNLSNSKSYPQSSYNFQNTPSFDFTHQATSASRKTDKRRGELHEHNKTPTESQNSQYENFSSNSPRHKSKRTCPETKEIDCTTDDGFWIQKQYYHALDDTSKQLFDSLIEKLEKIRIANEGNAAKKQQRLVGRNRSNKSKGYTSSIPYVNEENDHDDKDLETKSIETENHIKVDQSTDVNEEKENQQETSTIVVNQY